MASSIFARIGTIKGESRDARHRDEIDVLSWSWGLSQATAAGHGGGAGGGGAGRAGRPTFHDFSFVHHLDKASPLLMKACARGEHFSDATITVRKDGGSPQEYLVITMSDVMVTSVSSSVSAEADDTTEAVVLTFRKVDLEYRPRKADGTLDAGIHFTHDLQAHA
jgi:type VI secretion system secreted protein Hcp